MGEALIEVTWRTQGGGAQATKSVRAEQIGGVYGMRKSTSCAIAILCLAAAPALADWVPGDGHKMHFPQLPDTDGWDVNATFPKVLADDWTCSETGPVADVHFWGSWRNIDGNVNTDDIGNIISFQLSIHENIVDGGGGFSIPGALLWAAEVPFTAVRAQQFDPPALEGWFDPNTGIALENDHFNYWQYNIDLSVLPIDLFQQFAGEIYWLDISAVVETVAVAPQPMWGWKTADTSQYPAPFTNFHYLDDAVWGDIPQPMWQELRDPLIGNSLDLAFVITPEPSAVALLMLGAMTLLRRRWN